MSRFGCLDVLGVDPVAWAKRYDLDVATYPCGTCGAPCVMTIPMASRNLRGLRCPPCPCGNDRTPYMVVAAPGKGDLLAVLRRPRRPEKGKP